jgi:hypothetical protein
VFLRDVAMWVACLWVQARLLLQRWDPREICRLQRSVGTFGGSGQLSDFVTACAVCTKALTAKEEKKAAKKDARTARRKSRSGDKKAEPGAGPEVRLPFCSLCFALLVGFYIQRAFTMPGGASAAWGPEALCLCALDALDCAATRKVAHGC